MDDGRFAGFTPIDAEPTARANRHWWDAEAEAYRGEHAADLAGALVWGPEGRTEEELGLLGDVAGRDVLEIGAGAGDGAAWLRGRGARAVACDLSAGMLRQCPDPGTPLVQADARALPFAGGSFDVVLTAYGALPFVADPETVHREAARLLRPGGLWVFAVPHPLRWAFPDDPGEGGLTVTRSYFDTTPYLETGDDGAPLYAEHHRTLGAQVAAVVAAGMVVTGLCEPTWPGRTARSWGGWSPLRGRLIPGTAILSARRSSAGG